MYVKFCGTISTRQYSWENRLAISNIRGYMYNQIHCTKAVQNINMIKTTNDALDNDCLFDLDLLDQMCSGLDVDMQDKLDLELNVKFIDESNDERVLFPEHELMIPSKGQDDIFVPPCKLSDIFPATCESNVGDCLSWHAFLNATSNHNLLEANDSISEKEKRSLQTLRFPELLRTILDEEQHSSIISWQNDGISFAIHDKSLFETIVMPLYFQTNKWKSFQKQLNIYGFRKFNGQRRVHYHQFFVQDEPVLMTLMKREKVYPKYK